MTRPYSHIGLSYLFTAIILFGQVAVNYLHSKHNAHARIEKRDMGRVLFKAHHDHCKVCSLEVFKNLHFEPTQGPLVKHLTEKEYSSCQFAPPIIHLLTIPGRAPPVC